jgi:hypothetical protein
MLTIQEDLEEDLWSDSKRISSSKFSTVEGNGENSRHKRKTSIFSGAGHDQSLMNKLADDMISPPVVKQTKKGKKKFGSMENDEKRKN